VSLPKELFCRLIFDESEPSADDRFFRLKNFRYLRLDEAGTDSGKKKKNFRDGKLRCTRRLTGYLFVTAQRCVSILTCHQKWDEEVANATGFGDGSRHQRLPKRSWRAAEE
jgi:hypothetical protein